MNKIIFIILITFIAYSQSTGIAVYGAGENIKNSDPNSIAMGNSSFFSTNSKNISVNSPSSQWRSTLTRFTINSGISFLKNQNLDDRFNHNLTSFSLHFPVGNRKVFGFGLQPLFRADNIEIIDKEYEFIGSGESTTGKPIAIKNNYSINGGVSEFFFEYSQKLSSTLFSGGLKYSWLFGNQFLNDELYMYDLQIDTNNVGLNILEIIENNDTIYYNSQTGTMTDLNKYRKFSGNSLTMEIRYSGKKHEWVMKATANGIIKVKTTNIQTSNGLTHINSFQNISQPILYEIAFGYLNQIAPQLLMSMELHKSTPFNLPDNAFLFETTPPYEMSFHFGTYYNIINPGVGFWNNVNIGFGGFIKELDFSGRKYLDYGVTLGAGIEYLSNTQSFNLALRIGEKESMILTNLYERYISFHIGFTTGEKWFMKRRRK